MDKIEQLYPTERPGPLKVGDFVKHADRGLFLVARMNAFNPAVVGLAGLYSGMVSGPVVLSQGTSITAAEAVVLLGKLDGWHRLTRDEAAAELALPF